MSQKARFRIVIIVLMTLVIGLVLGASLRGNQTTNTPLSTTGTVSIYHDGRLVATFTQADLENVERGSFVDSEEGKQQSGPLLHAVLLMFVEEATLSPETQVTISSSSRGKSVTLTWAQIADMNNHVLFDASGRGTVKLASSSIESLDTRAEWIQDTDRIEINQP